VPTDSTNISEKLFKLPSFTNRKIGCIAVGDFHTLVVASGCTCMKNDITVIG